MTEQTADPRCADGPHDQSPETLIDRLFGRISEISSLPEVALRVMQVVDDPMTGAQDLLEAVRSDPVLAMRLMRTVNSSYYALPDKVGNLRQAITLLGFEEIRNLALTAYVSQLFRETGGHGRYSRLGLWNHLVGSGMAARLTARLCGRVLPQEAYLAGLLHDLGLILLDQYLPTLFGRVVDALTEETPVCEVEMRILGFDHAALGQFVSEKWNLPQYLVATIAYHHTPDQYQGPYRDMVYVTALANFFCHRKDITSLGIRNPQPPPIQLFTELGLQKQHVSQIWEQLDDALAVAGEMAAVQIC